MAPTILSQTSHFCRASSIASECEAEQEVLVEVPRAARRDTEAREPKADKTAYIPTRERPRDPTTQVYPNTCAGCGTTRVRMCFIRAPALRAPQAQLGLPPPKTPLSREARKSVTDPAVASPQIMPIRPLAPAPSPPSRRRRAQWPAADGSCDGDDEHRRRGAAATRSGGDEDRRRRGSDEWLQRGAAATNGGNEERQRRGVAATSSGDEERRAATRSGE